MRINTFPLDDSLVCLDSDTGRLHLANPIGAAIWRQWSLGATRETIVDNMEAVFDVSRDSLVADVDATIDSLERGAGFEISAMADYVPQLDPPPDRAVRATRHLLVQLPDMHFRVHVEDDAVARELEALFPLQLEDVPGSVLEVHIFHEAGRYPIVHDGQTLDTGLSRSDAVVKASRELGGLALRRPPWTAIVHASAVERDGKAVLFPAIGGSGKSTLAAWLVGKGYRLLNDDAVALSASTGLLRSVPVPFSIKAGSVPVLEPLWPGLDSLPTYGGGDRVLRYLAVSNEQASLVDVPCALVALPAWNPTLREPATLAPIAPSDVLRDIVEGGCTMRQPLDPVELGSLIDWLAQVPCVRLAYRDLEAARALLDEAVPGR